MPASPITIEPDRIRVGDRFAVSFQRTLRIPDDGKAYPLPPGLGRFPLVPVDRFAGRVPEAWLGRGGLILPMHRREALWIAFDAPSWHPSAVRVGIGGVDALTGEPWLEGLRDAPQDYLVAPPQLWLDGIKSGPGTIRQFVAVPLGSGDTVEGQLTGQEGQGGIQLLVYPARPGRFPEGPPPQTLIMRQCLSAPSPMGLAAGGTMAQKVYPDPHGLDTWDVANPARLFIQIVDADSYRRLTGLEPPPSPVDAATYARFGLPWFALEDEDRGDLKATDRLAGVKSLRHRDADRGETDPDEPASIPADLPVIPIRTPGDSSI